MRCVLVLLLSARALAQDFSVNLTDVDSSYVVDGTTWTDYKSIAINVCASCKVLLLSRFATDADRETSNFTVADAYGRAFNSKTFEALPTLVLYGSSSVDLSMNHVSNFSLIFSLLDKDTAKYIHRSTKDLYHVQADSYGPKYPVAVSDYPTVLMFTPPPGNRFPFSIIPSEVDDGCVISLFAGGLPTKDGVEKHILLNITQYNREIYSFSPILSAALTVLISPKCTVTLGVQKIQGFDPSKHTVTMPTVNNEGFISSGSYPGCADNRDPTLTPIDITVTTRTGGSSVTYTLGLANFEPGILDSNLLLYFDNDLVANLTEPVKYQFFNRKCSSFRVVFSPITTDAAFLLRYDSYF